MARMQRFRRKLVGLSWLLFAAAIGCSSSSAIPQPSEPAVRSVQYSHADVLKLLPVNSDQRCCGIAILMTALLRSQSLTAQSCERGDSLAEQLYEAAATNRSVSLPEFIDLGQGREPLLSAEGLEALSTLIADRYKRDHYQAISDEAATDRLVAATDAFLPSREQLEAVLAEDPAQLAAFLGVGLREFGDGEMRDTSHAFVLARTSAGRIMVYDPNDPRSPLPCQLTEEDGLLITWTGRYRDTGEITTQTYQVLPMQEFFKAAFK
jgi:hypothetical protein